MFFGRKKNLDGSFPVADGQVFGDVSVLVVDAFHAALVQVVLAQGHHHDVAGGGGLTAVDTAMYKKFFIVASFYTAETVPILVHLCHRQLRAAIY